MTLSWNLCGINLVRQVNVGWFDVTMVIVSDRQVLNHFELSCFLTKKRNFLTVTFMYLDTFTVLHWFWSLFGQMYFGGLLKFWKNQQIQDGRSKMIIWKPWRNFYLMWRRLARTSSEAFLYAWHAIYQFHSHTIDACKVMGKGVGLGTERLVQKLNE